MAAGKRANNIREARDEARRAITVWLDGRDPLDLQPSDRPTLAQALDQYVKRAHAPTNDGRQVKPITGTKVQGRPFGEWRLAEMTREALEAFRAQRPTVAGNRNLALLRALFNYAVVAGLVPASPFKVGTVSVVKLSREESRSRRLQVGEEIKLLAACDKGMDKRGRPWNGNPHLQALIIAALETGCRLGELQSLQWHQVGRDLFLPAGKTKAKRSRRLPISSRLQRLLDGRRNDPAGEPRLCVIPLTCAIGCGKDSPSTPTPTPTTSPTRIITLGGNLNFGNVTVGQDPPDQTMSVSNDGTANLNVSGISGPVR